MRTYLTQFETVVNGEPKVFGGQEIRAVSERDAQLWCKVYAPFLVVVGALKQRIKF